MSEQYQELKDRSDIAKINIKDAFKGQFKRTEEHGKRIDSVIYYYAIGESNKYEIGRVVYPDIEKLAKTHKFVSMLEKSDIPILEKL